MRERPILMSAPMVISTLNGTKGQTRRIATWRACGGKRQEVPASIVTAAEAAVWLTRHGTLECPYGGVGDALWVRESFEIVRETCSYEVEEYDYFDWDEEVYGPAKEALKPKCPRGGERALVIFKADGEEPVSKWRPSIHMPRWASRITLNLTGVRIERLNEISEEDAISEGIDVFQRGDEPRVYRDYLKRGEHYGLSATGSYRSLWESINGTGSWEANPWVWVLNFERRAVA